MAKKQSNFKPVNTSNIDTDVFIKGMNKDSHRSFVGKESWTHCRNCINNSAKGDAGTVGNEPATLLCITTGYTIIGAIYLYGDKWILYSTDDTNSEIGLFDDSECTYNPLVNDTCLNFNRFNLITGASKENFDCTWQVYWDDGLNPSRTINLGNKDEILENNYIPYVQVQVAGLDVNGDPCVEFENVQPLQLDCDRIRLAPLMKTPCVKLSKADSPGQLLNGSYQAYIAYLINEQQIGNYIGVSNVQALYDEGGTASSLDIKITNLDTNFSDYKLVLLINNQQQPQAIQVGIYSTHQTEINIDYVSENKATAAQVDIGELPLQNPTYERSDQMVPVNDYLLRIGPTTNFDFNYQPLANKITAKWVSVEYPAEYYKNGGSKPTFMRDEQYSFFIRFIYNTGDKSSSYHIPGRAYLTNNPIYGDEKGAPGQQNVLNNQETEIWQVNNTSFADDFGPFDNPNTDDGGVIISKGQMGYWESTEFYPAEDPYGRWQELCGQPIRHHKFPDEQTDETVDRSNDDNQKIRVLGVEFDNIAWPVDNEGQIIRNIVGYEILVGSRQGNKSILSKGIVRNMKQYTLPANPQTGGNYGADNPFLTDTVGLMPNYPYNDLRNDTFLTANAPDGGNSNNPPMPVGGAFRCGDSVDFRGCNNFYTFHSPETSFQRPFLNPSEMKTYGYTRGKQQGFFRPSEGHPKNVLIRDFVAVIAAFIGVGFAISKHRGKRKTTLELESGVIPGTNAINNGLLEVPETNFTASSLVGPGLGEVSYFLSTGAILDGATFASLPNTVSLAAIGQTPGRRKIEFEGTDVKSLPNIVGLISGLITTMHYAAVGGQEVVDLVYNIAGEHQYAYKYNSYGLYSITSDIPIDQTFRQNITKSRYVGNTFQDFGSDDIFTNVRINNLYRPATVVVQTNGTADNVLNALPTPFNFDVSRNTIGNLNITAFPTADVRSDIGAHYVAMKFAMDNQYGQLDGIKQVPIPCPQRFIRQGTKPDQDEVEVTPLDLIPYVSTNLDNLIPGEVFKTETLFGGDVYINRYSEKVIMPFFWEFLNGQPDNFGFDYRDYQNVPYPRYYMDTNKYDMHNLFAPLLDLSFTWSTGNAVPSAMRNMDKENDGLSGTFTNANGEINIGAAAGVGTGGQGAAQGSSLFVLRRAYMYTHVSGVNDFFVESELNLAYRAQGEGRKEKYYDWSQFTDLNTLFHSDIIKEGNFYKYDYSLSKSNLISQLISYSLIQGRDYDPNVAATCYDHYTKRVLYSLQAFKEAKQDFWRVYLPNNYKDFKNAPTTIKPISKTGAMILFPHLAPLLFEGVDTLTTDLDTKLTIGDGGLFSQPMKQITTADLPHEYGSCENSRSVINTPAGIYYISQAQGKIFNVSGQGLNNIADAGMKQWFNTYLPSRLLAAFPEIEGTDFADNPVVGIGCQAVYDPNYDIVYFSKKDYEPCNVDSCIEFDPTIPGFINPCENPPVEECPDGFILNEETGLCCTECSPIQIDNGDQCCTWYFQEPDFELPSAPVDANFDAVDLYLENGEFQNETGTPFWPDCTWTFDDDGSCADLEMQAGWGNVPSPWEPCMKDCCDPYFIDADGIEQCEPICAVLGADCGMQGHAQTTDILDGRTFMSPQTHACCGLKPFTGTTYLGLIHQYSDPAYGRWQEGASQELKNENGDPQPMTPGAIYEGRVVLAADYQKNLDGGEGAPQVILSGILGEEAEFPPPDPVYGTYYTNIPPAENQALYADFPYAEYQAAYNWGVKWEITYNIFEDVTSIVDPFNCFLNTEVYFNWRWDEEPLADTGIAVYPVMKGPVENQWGGVFGITGYQGQYYNRPELQIWGSMEPCLSEGGYWCTAFELVTVPGPAYGNNVQVVEYVGSPDDAELLWRSGDVSQGGTVHHINTGWVPYTYTLQPTKPWKYFNYLVNGLPAIHYDFNSSTMTGQYKDVTSTGAYLCLDSFTAPRVVITPGFCSCADPYTLVFDDGEYQTPATEEDCLNFQINGTNPVICALQECTDKVCTEPTLVNPPIDITNSEDFKDVSWTASYDPKIKGWISFHDWHPELTISSLNHFMTTKISSIDNLYCPPNYELNPITGQCDPINIECPEGSVLIDGECCSVAYGELNYNPGDLDSVEYNMNEGVVNMFTRVDTTKSYTYSDKNTIQFEIDDKVLQNIKRFKPKTFKLNIPFYEDETIEVTLEHTSVRKKDFVYLARTKDGYERKNIYPNVRTYKIKSDNISGILSISDNSVIGTLVKDKKISEIHRANTNTHVLYKSSDAKVKSTFTCLTENAKDSAIRAAGRNTQTPRSLNAQCITMAFDIDFPTANALGGDLPNFLETVVAGMSEIYTNELDTEIILGSMVVSEAEGIIYSEQLPGTTDEFGNIIPGEYVIQSSQEMLDLLIDTWTNTPELEDIERTTVHLITTRLSTGRAKKLGLCSKSQSFAVCGLASSFVIQGQPGSLGYSIEDGWIGVAISWPLKVLCHELGHNIGSSHTHAGYWQPDPNYNFPGGPIDSCDSFSNTYDQTNSNASGVDPNTLEWNSNIEYGTIMSYCQWLPDADDLMTFEFHPIVKDQILIPNLTQDSTNAILYFDVSSQNAVSSDDIMATPCLSCPDVVTDETYGCTDVNASNYNPNATIDDNSCVYDIPGGCTDPTALNYDLSAEVDDGSCIYDSTFGCTDPTAINYNANATDDDGSCVYPPPTILGCTDPAALNFDPAANTPCTTDAQGIFNFLNACCVYPPVLTSCTCPSGYIMIQAGSLNSSTLEYIEATAADCLNCGGTCVECIQINCTPLDTDSLEPSAGSGSLWKHNVRCDLFNNYYDVQYPWEIELVESIGQTVNTIRSIEYQLESYLHQPKLDEDGCVLNYGCDDRWHDLSYNFDEAIIYNTEQVSGLLTLTEQTADVNDIVSYPIIGEADINILYSKVEQKYRFDQFWDITKDRSVAEPIFITQLNGYVRDLNEAYMNYNKPQLERKKFRHYVNNLILRKKVIYQEQISDMMIAYPNGKPHTRKMLLKLVNTKINLSVR